MMTECKCEQPGGIILKPDGVHTLTACKMELAEIHRNVTVEVLQCPKCGRVSIGWYPQKDTEDEIIRRLI